MGGGHPLLTGDQMTITLSPDQEQAVRDAIRAG
jgi:hypothetical protein